MAVLVTNDFPPNHGGIQRCMSRIAQELARRGETITVVAPQTAGSDTYDAQQRFAVLRYANIGRLVGFAAMTATLLRARLADRRSYTVASMWFPGGLAACLLPKLLRGKLAVFAHGTEIAPSRGGLRRLVMRFVFSQADVIVANSRFTQALLKRAGIRKPASVVHLGIDGAAIAPQRSDAPIILSVGRLVRRKGFDAVISAMPSILREFPNARYQIVGDGPQRGELVSLVQRLAIEPAVEFLGAVSDLEMRDAYARAWCFALPVRAVGDDVEGFGLVYLEAALASLPAIGGINSGAEDAIVPGETGLLVDGLSAEAVTAGLLSILRDPDGAVAMGLRGRDRALQQFTWPLTAQSLATIMTQA